MSEHEHEEKKEKEHEYGKEYEYEHEHARIVFLVKVPAERRAAFLAAYERIRYLVAAVPGHIRDQVCRSATDPEQWLITSEWRRLSDFLAWEASLEHRDVVRPLRENVTEARSLRFLVHAETGAATGVQASAPTRLETGVPTGTQTGAQTGAGAVLR